MVIRSGRRDPLRLATGELRPRLRPRHKARATRRPGPKGSPRDRDEPIDRTRPCWCFDVGAGAITIGRSGENAIPLPDDDFASAKHARIEPQRDGIWIADLGSTNGTYVNGEQVERPRAAPHEGDVVKIGDTELRVKPMRLRWTPQRPPQPGKVPPAQRGLVPVRAAAVRRRGRNGRCASR